MSRWLIVRFSAIGDCVMAVPTAAAIRANEPDSQITWAVERRCAAVVDTDQLIQDLVEFPRDEWKARRWSPATWASQLAWYARLRKMKFDYGLDLQGHSKTALCLRLAAPQRRLAARATDSFARRLNSIASGDEAQSHVVERNLDVLEQLSGYRGPVQFVMPRLENLRERFRGRPLVTINVAAGAPDKCYPLERWRAIAEALRATGYKVGLVGGPGDPAFEVEDVSNWVGSLTLAETMAAVAESTLHLAGDTGTGHIAAAYGVPVISIFGPTDPARYRPYSNRATVLRAGTSTEDVTPESVLDSAWALLKQHVGKVSD